MTFYETLTPYYDQIFPANPKQLHFLSTTFAKKGRLLDVGAGTGNMAAALVEQGFTVLAAEPERLMAKQIMKKAEKSDKLTVSTLPMQQIEDVGEAFDGIYCVGNTLVHLNDMAEIQDFLHTAYSQLNDHGKLVIQIVNYEKVLLHQDFKFPVMTRETFQFERSYALADDKVLFTTTLTADGERLSNTIPLYPVTAEQLRPVLHSCGFASVETYGNFDAEPYSSAASPALIIVAKKSLI